MPGSYTRFDTLTIEEFGDLAPLGAEAAAPAAPVLARIPQIEPAPNTPDEKPPSTPTGQPAAESTKAQRHLDRAHDGRQNRAPQENVFATTFEVDALPAPTAPVPSQRRIDYPAADPAPINPVPGATNSGGASELDLSTPISPVNQATDNDEASGLTELIIRLEAAVAPYSQIIVLFTLLAAAGLTMMLLQGGGQSGAENGPRKPKLNRTSVDSPSKAEPLNELGPEPSLIGPAFGQADESGADHIPAPNLSASISGPVGIDPSRVAPVKPLEPHRESATATNTTPRVAIAPYPSTNAPGPATSDRPVARISGLLLPQEQQSR